MADNMGEFIASYVLYYVLEIVLRFLSHLLTGFIELSYENCFYFRHCCTLSRIVCVKFVGLKKIPRAYLSHCYPVRRASCSSISRSLNSKTLPVVGFSLVIYEMAGLRVGVRLVRLGRSFSIEVHVSETKSE